MNEASKKSGQRFSNNTQNPNKQRKDEEKRRDAEKALLNLQKEYHGQKSLLQLLPVIKLRYSRLMLIVAIERIERNKHVLCVEDRVFFERFKASLSA